MVTTVGPTVARGREEIPFQGPALRFQGVPAVPPQGEGNSRRVETTTPYIERQAFNAEKIMVIL